VCDGVGAWVIDFAVFVRASIAFCYDFVLCSIFLLSLVANSSSCRVVYVVVAARGASRSWGLVD